MATNELHNLITVDLIRLMVESHLPYETTEKLDYARVINPVFEGTTGVEKWRPQAWPILEALSKLRPDSPGGMPDMLAYLPPATDPDFPTLALGLQLFLDQAPSQVLKGVNKRWVVSYFADLALHYGQQLQALPPHQNPGNWECWKACATPDYFIAVRFWLSAPFVHHERTAEEGLAFTEATRVFVEETFGVRDPYRDQPEKRNDLYGFPNMVKEGPPQGPLDVPTGFFWLACVMDVHKPPLDKFGRYPYRDRASGRATTAEEEEWIKESAIFPRLPDDIATKIKEDVEAGIWSPLMKPE
ncbi:hypothetical protein H072_4660 [Dactylellina haptotyla CBS 200.50]|uniref:Uncharacterized protein n=1 Tax=Dactylellina haptotyla (strain CBS 200.50) TaxID=1284197 RepID=S8AJY6_DACHA|nr:hypothetical protein H072_4660 [Dactylellina haptotyla CBS 200.50]